MAAFIGKGVLEPYSCTVSLSEPVSATEIHSLMDLPKMYEECIIAVSSSRVLSEDDAICDGDEILVFVSPMGG